jgi:hypothetical protein
MTRRRTALWSLLAMAIVVTGSPALGAVIDFEGFADSTPLTTEIAGLTFTNATVISAGISLNEFEFPPFSGTNVVFDDGGPTTIAFAEPVFSVGGFFTYLVRLTMTAFDALGNPLDVDTSQFGSNLALSGEPGSSPNEFLEVSSPSGISHVVIQGDAFGSSFTLDDLLVVTNRPPVAQCQNVTAATDPGICTAFASVDAGSFDPDGDPITLDQSPAGPYGLGATGVTLAVTDDRGASDFCSAMVTVVDLEQPSILCPVPPTVECTSPQGATASFSATASDNCGTVSTNCPASGSTFPLGTTEVACDAVDRSGNTAGCRSAVRVVDSAAPVIRTVRATPDILWPPNHRMVPVSVTPSVLDVCDTAPACRIASVRSSEPIYGVGDGDTAPDWEVTGDLAVNLRAERSGKGSGRVYTIAVRCSDASGNNSTETVNVTVPHDRR